MQPSDPTPEEREARQECVNGAWAMAEAREHVRGEFAAGCARHDKALDRLTALAYQRGVRDAMAVVEQMPRQVIWTTPSNDLDAVLRGELLTRLRALTPPEPTE